VVRITSIMRQSENDVKFPVMHQPGDRPKTRLQQGLLYGGIARVYRRTLPA
jgi:hypothetical protein